MTTNDDIELQIKELEDLKSIPGVAAKLKHRLNTKVELTNHLSKFITQDPAMIDLKKKVVKLAPASGSVLILGPTGTGKELIARALHSGKSGKFVPVNCTALPSELIESELFGHEKGSFTGALATRVGKFELAREGTIFLDEIGDMPLVMQSKLLRVLQDKRFTRVGGNDELIAQCRVICATNMDLDLMVDKKLFREDLYYRISNFILRTTPLETRKSDIPLIVKHLAGEGYTFTSEIMIKLTQVELPGNVRQLENLVERIKLFGTLE
jgi:transcriptional regulator with GAF, ATPase, and Fis domain